MKRAIIAIILIAAAVQAALPQAKFEARAPQRVTVGDGFAVTYVLRNGEGSDLKASHPADVKKIYGPSVSTSFSQQIINGRSESSSRIEYTYYYKVNKPGKYSIGPATIVVNGKTLSAGPVTVEAVEGRNSGQGGAPGQGAAQQAPDDEDVDFYDIDTQTTDKAVAANDVFVRIILSKSTAYEQEAIECTIKLYTKYQISSFFPTLQPSFDGFLIQEEDVQPALNQEETYNGSRYVTAILKKCIIFPQKSGKLTINSGNYDISVVQFENVNMGLFVVRNPVERKIKAKSNSASIDIKPLPTPQPDGFSGAVGTFTAESRLVGDKFRTNDAATLLFTIKGTGNIKYIKEPEIDFPDEFEQYTPKSDIKADVVGQNVTGTMTIDYTFVPQTVGDFTIGAEKFIYFNPASREYVTVNTPAYNIKVAKGAGTTSTERQDIQAKNTDILHIVPGAGPGSHTHTLLPHTWWYWAFYIIAIGAFVAAMVVYRRNLRRSGDVVGTRLAKANKVSRKRLRTAEKFAAEWASEKFYAEMLRALWGYVSDKLAIPASQLNRDNISQKLLDAGAQQTTVDKLIDILDTCEFARYTPQGSDAQMQETYRSATSVINDLENLRIKKSI